MRDLFQKDLSEVQERLVDLSGSVTEIMAKASTAFLNSDVKKADEAIALCDIDNDYTAGWTKEQKIKSFFTKEGEGRVL